jgi:hypothetical protein
MMIEVEVQNFQSIERIAFLVEGFTAFVGRSNIGKSAVVRALRCALTGAPGTDFVRHGPSCERRVRGVKKCKCQASVRVKLPELTFLWEKGDSVNQYTVWRDGVDEPEVYSKIDRGTPDFLLSLFTPVKVGTRQELLQVSEQFSPIFLLNQGGNTVADVLSDVAQLDQINMAMGLVNKDRKSALATRTVREKDIAELGTSLERYEGLDAAVARARSAEQSYKALRGAQESLQRLDGYLGSLRALKASIGALRAATAPSTPDAKPLADKSIGLHQLAGYFQAVYDRAMVVRRLRGIEKVGVPGASPLQETSDKLSRIEGWLEQLRRIKARLEGLKRMGRLAVPAAPALQQTQERLVTLDRLISKQGRLVGAQGGLEAELAEVESEEQEILGAFGELGICPTCSQAIDADHCLHLGGD